ncbi:hypothetical protein P5X00_14610 [Paraburkholderia sp. A2RO-4L]|uniref:hypothetical protein n=1 Tax=Paraburkholderia sp. A2RO-4L TaxID=3028374 RepID=UPI003DA925FF
MKDKNPFPGDPGKCHKGIGLHRGRIAKAVASLAGLIRGGGMTPPQAQAVDHAPHLTLSVPGAHGTITGLRPVTALLTLGASSATVVSLGIATYAGWQRGGLPIERAINIALGVVAVVCVHLLPVMWRVLRVSGRVFAAALWGVSLVVVLYGQMTFFVVSQRHAGNARAGSIAVDVTPAGTVMLSGRTLTEIAQDIAKVRAELARAEARRCTGDCPSMKARETILDARLAALNTEAHEARRREAEEDRRNEHADRIEALRAALRADPVASQVASWLGTTESMLELLLAFGGAVVLEGAAVIGWSVAPGRAASRAGSRTTVASESDEVAPECLSVAPACDDAGGDRTAQPVETATGVQCTDPVIEDAADDGPVTLEDERQLEQIRKAVVAGQLKPTQAAIRTFLRCGQPKAGSLNRLYLARFGTTRS